MYIICMIYMYMYIHLFTLLSPVRCCGHGALWLKGW